MKKLILIAVSAAVAVSACIFACLSSESRTDEFFEANVEALADNEERGQKCYLEIKSDPNDQDIYCGTCTEIPGK